MSDELLWLLRTGSAIYIAWRLTILVGVNNPIMSIMCGIVLCVAAPFGLEFLLSTFEEQGSFTEIVGYARHLQIVAPLGFALLGVLMWSQVENIADR